MKLQLQLWALAVPLCSAYAIQDILHDLKDIENEVFRSDAENQLDKALESSPTFTPAKIIDGAEIHKYLDNLNFNSDTNWIKSFFASHPFDSVTNAPSTLVDDIKTEVKAETNPHASDKTIYQLISESKYTTILAKIIDEDSELASFLNSTEHKITVFAPTDDAFRKIPHHHRDHDHDGHDERDGGDDDGDHRIPKELIRLFAHYHSSPEVLTAAELFHAHTINSALNESLLGVDENGDGLPQRLAVRAGFKGLTINFYSHIVAADIGASNGLIHGLDSILLPPPRTLLVLDILPTIFSTFNLALTKTSLTASLNTTAQEKAHGFTLFTPSNRAFERLGLRINAFLFSPHGLPYLRALLKYHIVPNQTLYSDVLYKDGRIRPFGIKGSTHLDLPTLLEGHEISVDVARFGPYTGFKVNGWQRVAFADGLARDGVIHVLDHVLIPPRRVDGQTESGGVGEEGGLELEEFMERLRPYVEDGEAEDDIHGDL
ncbi:fasciclin domain-containing protein [Aspergillus mulundensis]|uniref:FAS1 domain-containing protein n=1 Tax=Aspergillus mulundensis TaxID=1810919 RepID=A0A3D8SUP4_9EURO|nr:hypothetical protein DSM5745_01790 [Aspergillus mulundensis]RDW90015.1 hypothetical protein DSM5745_01790 [Aspergillus mulundensis]